MEKTLEIHLQDLRNEIAQEIFRVAKNNDLYSLPLEVIYPIVRGTKLPEQFDK